MAINSLLSPAQQRDRPNKDPIFDGATQNDQSHCSSLEITRSMSRIWQDHDALANIYNMSAEVHKHTMELLQCRAVLFGFYFESLLSNDGIITMRVCDLQQMNMEKSPFECSIVNLSVTMIDNECAPQYCGKWQL